MYPNPYGNNVWGGSSAASSRTDGAMAKVYQWMALGLGVTGATSMVLQNFRSELMGVFTGGLVWVLVAGLAVLSMALQGWATRMSAPVAFALFFAYAALMGLALTPIFWIYDAGSIGAAFVVTGGAFAALSIYGYVTKRDLSGLRTFLVMGVWGLFLASIVNMLFFRSMGALYWVSTYAGVLVFSLMTAYKTQEIKRLLESQGGAATVQMTIQAAVALYVSFVNLFIYILRILGSRRSD